MQTQRIYKTAFEAAHIIEGHPKCGVKHGHSYHLNTYFNGDTGTWVDFHDLKLLIELKIEKDYDHKDLGNRTAEEIAEEFAIFLENNQYSGHLELYETEKFGVKVQFGQLTIDKAIQELQLKANEIASY